MKRLIMVAALLAVVTALAPAEAAQEREAAAGPVTIDYSFWGNPVAIGVERDIIDAFHELQEDIRVAPVVSGHSDYHAMLLTQLAAGSGPDVMRVDSYSFQDFQGLNALRPIDELVERDGLDLSVYYQQGIEENTYEGRLYGLPWATSPLYMFVNLNAFERAGVEVPDFDWTVDDFEQIARELTTDDTYGFGIAFGTITSVLPFVWANGGDFFDEPRDRGCTHPLVRQRSDRHEDGIGGGNTQYAGR